jgi:putative membrane protein
MRILVAGSCGLALLALGACKTREGNTAADTTAARTDTAVSRVAAATDTGARRVDSAAGSLAKRGGWTSASVLGFARAASNGEIREGELAERKATTPAVKAFARQMVADHRTLLSDGKALATKLKVTPDTADDDVRDVTKHASDDIKDLTDKKAGLDWDEAYIDNQIKDHKDVLDKLQDASKNTTDPDLRAALEKATGKVQEHLTKAQDIKDNALKNAKDKASNKDTTKK